MSAAESPAPSPPPSGLAGRATGCASVATAANCDRSGCAPSRATRRPTTSSTRRTKNSGRTTLPIRRTVGRADVRRLLLLAARPRRCPRARGAARCGDGARLPRSRQAGRRDAGRHATGNALQAEGLPLRDARPVPLHQRRDPPRRAVDGGFRLSKCRRWLASSSPGRPEPAACAAGPLRGRGPGCLKALPAPCLSPSPRLVRSPSGMVAVPQAAKPLRPQAGPRAQPTAPPTAGRDAVPGRC